MVWDGGMFAFPGHIRPSNLTLKTVLDFKMDFSKVGKGSSLKAQCGKHSRENVGKGQFLAIIQIKDVHFFILFSPFGKNVMKIPRKFSYSINCLM